MCYAYKAALGHSTRALPTSIILYTHLLPNLCGNRMIPDLSRKGGWHSN